MILGTHAARRFAERLGMKGDRARNKARMALLDGVPREKLRGELRGWVDRKYFNHDPTHVYKVYRGTLYVFTSTNEPVTNVPVPHKMYIRAKQRENRKKKRL